MSDTPPLSPADPDKLASAIAYALCFDGRGKPLGVQAKADHSYMARNVMQQLERSGYLVTKKPSLDRLEMGVPVYATRPVD
ncbi:hypothetical protein [Roseomonas elaeocarpi]|uniref:Uncharacterized protein n=1 Tax=Roseomonas elaeocarpi TaxID=907779 RepID=A0ABV6JPF6_9PROT